MIDRAPQEALSAMIGKATPGQLAALGYYFKVCQKGRTAERRERLWQWAERTCNSRMQPLVRELHQIVSTISSDLERELAK